MPLHYDTIFLWTLTDKNNIFIAAVFLCYRFDRHASISTLSVVILPEQILWKDPRIMLTTNCHAVTETGGQIYEQCLSVYFWRNNHHAMDIQVINNHLYEATLKQLILSQCFWCWYPGVLMPGYQCNDVNSLLTPPGAPLLTWFNFKFQHG